MQSIAYSNTSDEPVGPVQIDWTFDGELWDHNSPENDWTFNRRTQEWEYQPIQEQKVSRISSVGE